MLSDNAWPPSAHHASDASTRTEGRIHVRLQQLLPVHHSQRRLRSRATSRRLASPHADALGNARASGRLHPHSIRYDTDEANQPRRGSRLQAWRPPLAHHDPAHHRAPKAMHPSPRAHRPQELRQERQYMLDERRPNIGPAALRQPRAARDRRLHARRRAVRPTPSRS